MPHFANKICEIFFNCFHYFKLAQTCLQVNVLLTGNKSKNSEEKTEVLPFEHRDPERDPYSELRIRIYQLK
jgi:hypothetical protein